MANTSVTYVAAGSVVDYAVPFPYLQEADIVVLVNNTVVTNPLNYTISSPTTITFTSIPIPDSVIKIKRSTSIDTRLVDYQSGAILTEEELDLDSKQAFYLAQEINENYSDLIDESITQMQTDLGLTGTTTDDILAAATTYLLNQASAAEIQARITDIDLNAESIIELGLDVVAAETLVNALNVTVSGFGGTLTANSNAITALDVRVTTNEGTLTTQASDISTLRSDLTTAEGNITGNAAAVSALTTRVTTAEGNITVTAADVTALTSRVTTAEGDISSAEVTILAHTSAISTAEGDIVSLEAGYGVSLNVNGYITGFTQLNNGSSGSFQILADEFYIVDPSVVDGQNPVIPFSVVGGTVYLENVTIASAGQAGTGQRAEISSADNEIVFYGDRGDGVVTEQAAIGIRVYSTDTVIGYFGTDAASQDNIAVLALSNTNIASYHYSVGNHSLYAICGSASHFAISAISASTGTAIRGEGVGNGGIGVEGQALASTGGYGILGTAIAGAQSGYGGYFKHNQTYGIPLFIKPDVTNVDPQTTSISEGSIWMAGDGNRGYLYRDDTWADLTKPKPINVGPSGATYDLVATGGLDIPPECTKVTIWVYLMSTNSASIPMIQLKDTAFKTTFYNHYVMESNNGASSTGNGSTTETGFKMSAGWVSGRYWTGKIELHRRSPTNDNWMIAFTGTAVNGQAGWNGAGYIGLSGDLTDIRFTTVAGTATFSSGQITAYAERF